MIDSSTVGDAGADHEALHRLREIKHIVVLMMENRSFDQMLGFLSKNNRLDGVNGLVGGEVNYDTAGNPQPSFEWEPGETSFHPPQDRSGKLLDPCHGPTCVQEQLETFHDKTPGGFVKNFVGRTDKDGNPIVIPPEYWHLPMGYYSEKHLPVYDLLARQYCVCDAWHASIPGDTWPNRLYAMAGRTGTGVLNKPGFWHELLKRLKVVPGIGQLANAPVFEVDAFTHQLDPLQWRWYSHDPATLRAADKNYRDIRNLMRENFAYFDRKRISFKTEVAEGLAVELHDGFLDDAAKGQLRGVSWIDPNFIDLKILDANSNDDHPPSDVHAGQALVLETYEALVNSPDWQDTLLIIVYDEHGGFYDHVSPPSTRPGDPSLFATLGVRVPALIVGPRVKKHVCSDVFEHTTLIATILRCLLDPADEKINNLPWRVHGAPHLGSLMEANPRPELVDRDKLRGQIAEARAQLDQWRAQARQARRAKNGQPSPVADGGAGQPQELLDWQEQFMGFALTMRDKGLPPGQP
jgi:phospholipase C